ncbi:MAG: hypothetical protein AVDCRST_MAG24-1438, partial [uncultured Nocardioidaceae bacterium]
GHRRGAAGHARGDRHADGRRRVRRGHRRAARGLAHARPHLGRRAARRTPAGGSRGAVAL